MLQLDAHRIRVLKPDISDQGHGSQTSRLLLEAANKMIENNWRKPSLSAKWVIAAHQNANELMKYSTTLSHL
jgi:hypothetical protein